MKTNSLAIPREIVYGAPYLAYNKCFVNFILKHPAITGDIHGWKCWNGAEESFSIENKQGIPRVHVYPYGIEPDKAYIRVECQFLNEDIRRTVCSTHCFSVENARTIARHIERHIQKALKIQ